MKLLNSKFYYTELILLMSLVFFHSSCREKANTPESPVSKTKLDSIVEFHAKISESEILGLSRQEKSILLRRIDSKFAISVDSLSEQVKHNLEEMKWIIIKDEYQHMYANARGGTSLYFDSKTRRTTTAIDIKVEIAALDSFWSRSKFAKGGIRCFPYVFKKGGLRYLTVMIAATYADSSKNDTLYLALTNGDLPYDWNELKKNLGKINKPQKELDTFKYTISTIELAIPVKYSRYYPIDSIRKFTLKNDSAKYIGFEIGYIDNDYAINDIWKYYGAILRERENLHLEDIMGTTILLPLYDKNLKLVYNPTASRQTTSNPEMNGMIMEIGKPCPPYCSNIK